MTTLTLTPGAATLANDRGNDTCAGETPRAAATASQSKTSSSSTRRFRRPAASPTTTRKDASSDSSRSRGMRRSRGPIDSASPS